MTPSFVAIAPRPPAENFTQAFQEGQANADRSRLVGAQTSLSQQQLQQEQQLAPSRLQLQQAQAQEQQLRVQQMQQQQRDANIQAAAMRTVLGAPQQQNDPNASAAPAGRGAPVPDAPTKDPDDADDKAAEKASPTAAPATATEPVTAAPTAAALHPAVTQAAPGISPIVDGGDIYGRMLAEATKNGLSPQGQLAMAQQIMARKQDLAKFTTEQLKQKTEQYDQVAGRVDAFVKQPDDYKSQHWAELLDGMTRDGLMSPQEHNTTLQKYPQYPGDQVAGYLGTAHLAESELMKRNLNEADIASKNASTASTKAETQNRQAQLPGIQAKADQQQIENWAQKLGAARDQDSYDAVRVEMPKKYADQLPDDFDAKTTPALIDRWGQTAQQRVASDAIAARNARTAQHETALEQQGAKRNQIAQERADATTNRAGGAQPRPMTQAQWQHQADSLATEGRGYVTMRAQLRTALASGYVPDRSGNPVVDTQGKPVALSGAQRQAYQNQVGSVTANLQNLQYRTAQFLKIPVPPQDAISKLGDGDEIHSPDGHVWKMQDGVVYPIK